MSMPAYNRKLDQYYLSDGLSSNSSSLSKEHSDGNISNTHREQITNQNE